MTIVGAAPRSETKATASVGSTSLQGPRGADLRGVMGVGARALLLTYRQAKCRPLASNIDPLQPTSSHDTQPTNRCGAGDQAMFKEKKAGFVYLLPG
jgi:hypothetical protein